MIAVIPNARHITKVKDLLGDCVEVAFFDSIDELKHEIKTHGFDVDNDTRIVDGGKMFTIDVYIEEAIHIKVNPL